MTLLGDFERIVILKTKIFEVDRNFLSKADLEDIAYAAYEMEIDNFPKYDLEDLYYDDNRIDLVYDNYKKFTLKEFEKLWNEISEKLGGI